MPRKPILAPETLADILFPAKGIDLNAPFSRQKPDTAAVGQNVLAYEASSNRKRGGSRPGLAKYVAAQVGGTPWIIQELEKLTTEGPAGAGMQTNSSGRIVTLVAVSQGQVYYLTAGGSTWTLATNSTGKATPLNFTGVVRSAVNGVKMWFADGNNWAYFNPADNAVHTWTASAGALPVDSNNNTPRLITTWRGRTVLGGLLLDSQNWFMSAVNDPTNFDDEPQSPSPTQAIAGNNAPQGLVGDVLMGMCPYNDDLLIFFGDHSIYFMSGDPLLGGQLDRISDVIGGVWGVPWCKDPYGTVYFLSNRAGIYALMPGRGPPVRISQQIEQLLAGIDTGQSTVRLIWDDAFQGFHVFVTPTSQAAAATHFFFEQRTGAWWTETFANPKHNPLCCVAFDGNTSQDRRALIGSWDGYVRYFEPAATTDDGWPLQSQVLIGPLQTANLGDVLFKDLQAVLGEQSGQVTFSIYAGITAEAALASGPIATGTWHASRNNTFPIRRAAHALYVGISATGPWSMEMLRARVDGKLGKVRERSGA